MPSHPSNIMSGIPERLPEEICQTLMAGRNVRIERIVSWGQGSPEGCWYDQLMHEWVLVLQGAARLRLEGEEPLELQAVSYLNISAHQRHRVEWTSPDQPTIWLAIHYT